MTSWGGERIRAVRGHAEAIAAGLGPGVRDGLRDHAVETVRSSFDLSIEFRSEQRRAGTCSVDGQYLKEERRIVVARSASVRRRHFTLLHELAHHLQRHDPDAVDFLRAAGSRMAEAEEAACDAFAAEILVPFEAALEQIGYRGPKASDVLALFDSHPGSRMACCVRAAQLLSGEGWVMLGRDGVAAFTAIANHPYGVGPDTPQEKDSVFALAARTGRARGETRIRFSSGALGRPLHGDAVRADDGYVFAVMVSEAPPWEQLSLPPLGGFDAVEVVCSHCETEFPAYGRPHRQCAEYRCPACERCGCAPAPTRERLCRGCFTMRAASQFNRDPDQCDDCTG